MKILVIDVGGTNIKLGLPGRNDPIRIPSGPQLTAAMMVKAVKEAASGVPFDAVSIGYPGAVVNGKPTREPANLGSGWMSFDYALAFGKPVQMLNDAAMQALGSYHGGRMLFLGLGTGLGSALVTEQALLPLELAHLPYRNNRTFEDYLGVRGLKRMGRKKWQVHVEKVIEILKHGLQADYVMLGGGNTKKLKDLPPEIKTGTNSNAIEGGFRLWKDRGKSSSKR